jgi:hypothetical protein
MCACYTQVGTRISIYHHNDGDDAHTVHVLINGKHIAANIEPLQALAVGALHGSEAVCTEHAGTCVQTTLCYRRHRRRHCRRISQYTL